MFNETATSQYDLEVLTSEKVSGETALELFNEEIGIGEMGDVSEQLNSEEGNAVIRKNGYDGIINSIGGGPLRIYCI